MSSKVKPAKLEDLLALFEDVVDPEDVLCAKLMSQASKAITKERLDLQMNQKEFAEHIHATQSLVSRWEHGDYNFSLKKLSSIAAALDMDIHLSMSPRKSKSNEIKFITENQNSNWNTPLVSDTLRNPKQTSEIQQVYSKFYCISNYFKGVKTHA